MGIQIRFIRAVDLVIALAAASRQDRLADVDIGLSQLRPS